MDLLVGIVLVLGIMILVHELGHFAVARLFGVRVDVFSIGFGPRLFGWKRGATDYRVSLLPLGGYVRMAGQDFGEDRTGAPDELVSKPRWQRAFVAFAGPFVNLVFPVLLLAGFFMFVGLPHFSFLDQPVQVVAALPANASVETPLRAGDRILFLNGTPNPTWEQAQNIISEAAPGSTLKFEAENNGARRSLEIPVKDNEQKRRLLGYAPIRPVVDEVLPGMPAYRAGLREGDRILAVDGMKIESWGQFVDAVKHSNGRRLAVEVQRNGQIVRLDLTPQQGPNEAGETVWQIGVLGAEDLTYKRVGIVEGARYALVMTSSGIEQVFGVVAKLFSGRVSVKQLQSFVGISREAGQAVRKGPFAVISLMAVISVNLGILNLLPIPILDGGHILLLAIESFLRRDLSMAFKERFVQVGFVFLLVLFGYVMYNDVVRMLPPR